MPVEIGNIFEDNKANVRSVNPNTLIASTFTDPHDRPSFIIESNKRRHSSSVHSITSNLEKMAHMCTQQEELTGLVATLTAYYMQNIAFHFCKMHHVDVNCCAHAEMIRNGSHPQIKVVYITPELEAAARIIIREMIAQFPAAADIDDDDDGLDDPKVIFMCPVCGVKFSRQ